MAFASASFAALVYLASLFAAPPAEAAPPSDLPPSDLPPSDLPPSEGPAHEPDARETAKQAFDAGLVAVAAGEYEVAVSAFERAYGLRPHTVTLFNLALALEKAGRLPEAWELFDDIVGIVESNAERREVRRHMRTIEAEIAIVEIDAKPKTRLCIDGIDMPEGDVSDFRLAVEPGRHELLLDDQLFAVAFEAGDRRVLLLEDAEELLGGRRRGVLMPAMIGTAIGTGTLSLALGIGAAVSIDSDTRTGLAASAATGAGLAVTAGIIALLLETRKLDDPTARVDPEGGESCPGSTVLERRLDLRIGPTIGRPAEFALLPMPSDTMPAPVLMATFPHPHGIQPPRNTRDE
jgi:tetratricopeptide (TPR) repeat protein